MLSVMMTTALARLVGVQLLSVQLLSCVTWAGDVNFLSPSCLFWKVGSHAFLLAEWW